MRGGPYILAELDATLRPHGIFVRGTVCFTENEEAPALMDDSRAQSVVLLGNIGGSIWAPFKRWRQLPENSEIPDPLDTWSKAIIRPVAKALSATAYFPSDPPWQPFQQWAMKAEGLQASPLGILIHSEYGLWHGYRGALGFGFPITRMPATAAADHPCDHCPDKPCLSACPVDAVTLACFDVASCRAHLASPQGKRGCMQGGCLARSACPVGASHRYGSEQLLFHMEALRSFP